MQNVFWFTGRFDSGKTTLTKKLKKILEKDFSIQVIDGDEYVNKLRNAEEIWDYSIKNLQNLKKII